MALPSPINIEAGLGDIIRAIDEILERPKREQDSLRDETLTRLREQLEIAWTAVTKLEKLFVEILRGYRDVRVLENPEALRAHLGQTYIFLESREVLPRLDRAIGTIEAAADSPRFEGTDYQEMANELWRLYDKLDEFRGSLGEGGITAPGFWQLLKLCELAERQLSTGEPVNREIVETAVQAYEDYDWRLSSDINKLIGKVILNS